MFISHRTSVNIFMESMGCSPSGPLASMLVHVAAG